MSDDLIRDLQDLGGTLTGLVPDPEELRRVRRGIVRRRRVRVAGAAGLTAAAVAVVAVIALPGTDHRAGVVPTQPTVQVSTPATMAVTTPGGSPVTTPPPSTPPASGATQPPTSTADVFAEVTSAGAVEVVSATDGSVVRTVAPAGSTGGRDFAVVGPSGRYVYFTDIDGASRVPLAGGTAEQLPRPQTGDVGAIYADRSDTRFEETVGYADDSKPHEVFAVGGTGTTPVDLGTGEAAGWDASGAVAYVTTSSVKTAATATTSAAENITVTGIDVANPSVHGYAETNTSPGGQDACGGSAGAGIADDEHVGFVLGGCGSSPALAYVFRVVVNDQSKDQTLAPVQASFPAADDGFFVDSVQYTPAGTAVFALTHQDCSGSDLIAVLRGTGDAAVNLPAQAGQCTD